MTDDELKALQRECELQRVSALETGIANAALITAGMTAIDARATALILRDQVKHLENALREAGNLARALERRLADSESTTTALIAEWLLEMDEYAFRGVAEDVIRGAWKKQ